MDINNVFNALTAQLRPGVRLRYGGYYTETSATRRYDDIVATSGY